MNRLILVALIGAATVVVGSQAPAAASCDYPNLVSRFDGAKSNYNVDIFGGRARIEYNSASPLCSDLTFDTGSSGICTMVTAHSASAPSNAARDGWAQVGYVHNGSSLAGAGRHVFYQWTRQCKATGSCGAGSIVATGYDPAPTGTQFYSVYRKASTGTIVMYAGTTLEATMGYDTSGIWQPNWQVQYFGETKNVADDIAGTSSDKTSFDYLQKYDSAGDLNFFADLNYPQPDANKFQRNVTSPAVGGVGIDIWTQ